MTYELISEESLEEIKEQIEYIYKINAKSKKELIKELKEKIEIANKNTKYLEKLENILNVKIRKKEK